jgi:hypothetical protein
MAQTLDLRQMTVAEKLRLMEDLWTDLSSENLASPAWHGELLAERERLTESGEEKFLDWEIAKRQLREEME